MALAIVACFATAPALAQTFLIDSARWDQDDSRIVIRGQGTENRDVTVRNAFDLSQVLGHDDVDDGFWRVRREDPSPIPCRVRAEQEGGGGLTSAT